MSKNIIKQITDGRTDLVFDYLAAGHAATSADKDGTRLIKWCAYYGDVSAIRFLLANGESIQSLGDNLDLNGAAFHGHWRLCQFLIEQGADVNKALRGYRRVAAARGSLHIRTAGSRPRDQGAPWQWGKSQLRDQAIRRNGWFHARLQNQR